MKLSNYPLLLAESLGKLKAFNSNWLCSTNLASQLLFGSQNLLMTMIENTVKEWQTHLIIYIINYHHYILIWWCFINLKTYFVYWDFRWKSYHERYSKYQISPWKEKKALKHYDTQNVFKLLTLINTCSGLNPRLHVFELANYHLATSTLLSITQLNL